jgi:hypothetical protein
MNGNDLIIGLSGSVAANVSRNVKVLKLAMKKGAERYRSAPGCVGW